MVSRFRLHVAFNQVIQPRWLNFATSGILLVGSTLVCGLYLANTFPLLNFQALIAMFVPVSVLIILQISYFDAVQPSAVLWSALLISMILLSILQNQNSPKELWNYLEILGGCLLALQISYLAGLAVGLHRHDSSIADTEVGVDSYEIVQVIEQETAFPQELINAWEYISSVAENPTAFFDAPKEDPQFIRAFRVILNSLSEEDKQRLLDAARRNTEDFRTMLQAKHEALRRGFRVTHLNE